MKYENICTKRTWTQNGEEKHKWLVAGTLRTLDSGKQFIELNHLPDVSFYVFEPKPKDAGQPRSDTMNQSSDKFPPDDVETVDLSKPDEM